MNTNIVLLGAVIAVAGRWAEGKNVDVRAVIAMFLVALMLTVIAEANEELGRAFAFLILFSMIYAYLPSIVKKVAPTVQGMGSR